MRKLLLAAPVFLLATACSDIGLGPVWSECALPGGPALGLRDIAAGPTGEAWVVGRVGEAWYYDGDSWEEKYSGFHEYDLTGVAPDEGGRCWAVGFDNQENGRILRYD
ncbi:MAG: hypothetical protein NTW26_01675, partial [bacterium]|nr:hypothetical protein [bacterium]